jgi:hypothetical protein
MLYIEALSCYPLLALELLPLRQEPSSGHGAALHGHFAVLDIFAGHVNAHLGDSVY